MAEPVDLIVGGGYVVTIDSERRMLRNGAVAVRNGRIVAVDQTDAITRAYTAKRTIDARDKVVLPGLIDGHMHLNEGPRGIVPDDISTLPWIREWMHPIFAGLDEQDERHLARLAIAEALKTGTTTIVEGGTMWHSEVGAEAAVELGARLYIGRRAWDLPQRIPKWRMTADQALRTYEDMIANLHGTGDGRVRVLVHLIGQDTQTDALLLGAKDLAKRHGLSVCMHQSLVEEEIEEFKANHNGKRPMQHLGEIGALDERLRLVHMIAVDEAEAKIVMQSGVRLVHCISCALKAGYGASAIGRFPEFIRAGMPVSLGADGANCTNFFDMVRAMHLVATLYKDARRDVTNVPAETALEMATINGAKSLLAEHELGSLEPGKLADMVLFDTSRVEWQPLTNVVYNLVYSSTGSSVDTVIVSGDVVVEKGRLTRIDEQKLIAEAKTRDWRKWLAERTNLSYRQRWPEI